MGFQLLPSQRVIFKLVVLWLEIHKEVTKDQQILVLQLVTGSGKTVFGFGFAAL
jgi:hypothetical protein